MSTLTLQEARQFYDKFGAKQDKQAFYEDTAINALISHAHFEQATSVFELGCGTGRFAAKLLDSLLPPTASYHGIDVSRTMVELARQRLSLFDERVRIEQTNGETRLPAQSEGCDRFISNYVFDLLSEKDIRAVLKEAYRILRFEGLIGLVSLTHGFTFISKIISNFWLRIHSIGPKLVGGCRPIELTPFIRSDCWEIQSQQKVAPFGIPSEIVVAKKI